MIAIIYLVVDTTSSTVTLSLPVRKKIYVLSDFSPEGARLFFNETGLRLGMDSGWNLKIVSNGSVEGEIKVGTYSTGTEITSYLSEVTDAFREYRVFITDEGQNWVEISAAEKGSFVTIQDEDQEVFNYSLVRINSEMKDGSGRIIFLGDMITMDKQTETATLDDPDYYKFHFDYYDKKRFWGTLGVIPVKEEEEEKTITKEWRGFDLRGNESQMVNLTSIHLPTKYIKVDGNGDGDLGDAEDYVKYNQFLVVDGYKPQLKLAYTIVPHYIIKPKVENLRGTIIQIDGQEYLVTEAAESAVTVGEPVRVEVKKRADTGPGAASQVMGTTGFAMDEYNVLYIYKGEGLEGVTDLSGIPEGTDISSQIGEVTGLLQDYRVFITAKELHHFEFALVNRTEQAELVDGQENVMGYALVRINTDEVPGGQGRLNFFSPLYTLSKNVSISLEDVPYFNLEVNSLGEFRVKLGSIPKTAVEMPQETLPPGDVEAQEPGPVEEAPEEEPATETPLPETPAPPGEEPVLSPVEEEPPVYKVPSVCGPTVLLLISWIPLLWRRTLKPDGLD
jgi:hypothetical protein